jgi:hypothetical protein
MRDVSRAHACEVNLAALHAVRGTHRVDRTAVLRTHVDLVGYHSFTHSDASAARISLHERTSKHR